LAGQLVEPAGSQWQWLEMERHPALGFEATHHPKILHLSIFTAALGAWSVQNPFPALCRYNALTSSSCPALATVRHQGRAAAWSRVWDGMLPDFHSPLGWSWGFYDELLELLSNIAK